MSCVETVLVVVVLWVYLELNLKAGLGNPQPTFRIQSGGGTEPCFSEQVVTVSGEIEPVTLGFQSKLSVVGEELACHPWFSEQVVTGSGGGVSLSPLVFRASCYW